MGPPGSPIAFAATTVAERYKFPMILGPSNDPQIFARGFSHIQGVLAFGEEWSRNLFDMFAHDKTVHSVALLVEDSLFSRGIGIGIRKYANRDNLSVVFDQTVPSDTQDFTAIIVKMKEAKPDLVYVATFPPFFIRFAKQANELGLKPSALECATCASASVREALGSKADGITGEVYWVPGMTYGNYEMLEKVLKLSGVDPVQWTSAIVSLASLEVIKEGIEKTGTLDRDAVFDTHKEIGFHDRFGAISCCIQRLRIVGTVPYADTKRESRLGLAARGSNRQLRLSRCLKRGVVDRSPRMLARLRNWRPRHRICGDHGALDFGLTRLAPALGSSTAANDNGPRCPRS